MRWRLSRLGKAYLSGSSRNRRCKCPACIGLLLLAPAIIGAGPVDPGEHLLQYIQQTTEYYRRATAFDQAAINSEELLFRDTIHDNSRQILQLGFAFAKAEAALLASSGNPTSAPSGASGNLAHLAATAAQRINNFQTELAQLNAQIPDASGPALVSLTARRDKLIAAINLAKARNDVLQNFIEFNSGNNTSGGLVQKIDDLQRAYPDSQAGPAAQSNKAAITAAQTYRPESTGILSLLTEMLTLSSRMGEVKAVRAQTESLWQANQAFRAPIRTELMEAVHRADTLSQSRDSDDPKTLDEQRQSIDALAARFKLLAAAAVPLGEQNVFLDSAKKNLDDWHAALGRTYSRTVRALCIRVGAIVVTILVLLGISSIWRRATFRYVHDIRRRRQFLFVRRLVVGAIITVVVIGGVVTELNSLATFAGLITAGIAVALQTVILSGAAHFFFMGRYGVRVGDRVTISGITGDVVDIGVFRLYLMELSGNGRALSSTGRIVVFSNSVLFQPSAFFKQIPGAEYVWHEVALTLSPETDHKLAEERLMDAVNKVYNGYKESIERQYAAVQENIHLQMPLPVPKGRLRFIDAGLEFAVRYPVEIRRSAEIDDLITRQLIDTISAEPKLKLVASGTPRIQAADGVTG